MLMHSRQPSVSYKGLVHPKNQKKFDYHESRSSESADYGQIKLLILLILIVVWCILPFFYLKDWIKIVTG